MKKFILLVLLIISFNNAKSVELSDSLHVSLLTVSPGSELYSVFGHTAVRITDLKNGFDIVFNYGTFDFQTSNFYLKFALGGLDYMISVETYEHFVSFYIEENRTVIEQNLNFNKNQRLKLAQLLIVNNEPQNRFYRYKFFTDNCSTRIRDIITEASGDVSVLAKPAIDSEQTFHKLYTSYLGEMPWAKFGIGLVLGSLTDKKAGYDALFLPDNLMKAVDKARLDGKPLVENNHVTFQAKPSVAESFVFSPIMMAVFVLLTAIFIQILPNLTIIYDRVFFFIFGFLGVFVATLSILSHHAELHYNFVLLFILPTHILIPFFIKNVKFMKYYAGITMFVAIVSFIAIKWIPQTFNAAFILLALAVIIRLYFNFISIIKART